VFAACSAAARRPARRRPRPRRGPASVGRGCRAITVGYLPKDIVNQYFAAAKTGVDKAAGELGGRSSRSARTRPTPDLQIPFITDLTTQKVSAIIISADGKDEVAPALKAAMAAGIKVVGFDSSPAVGAYNVFVNQVDFSGVGVNLADWACELAPSCTGDIAILSAAATATNQNAWIDLMKTTLKLDKYKGLNLVDTVYGNDDATVSTSRRRACSPSTPTSRSSWPRRRSASSRPPRSSMQAGKSASVKVTGLGFPNDMKPFVKDGTSPVFGLWSVPDLGYLSYWIAAKLVSGEIKGTVGETFTVPSPQRWQAVHDRQRTARSSSDRRSGSTRRTSTSSTSRPRRTTTRPLGATLRGLVFDSRGAAMERSASPMRCCPAPSRIPASAMRPSGRRCSPRSAAGLPELLDLIRGDENLFGYLEVDDFDRGSGRRWPPARWTPAGRPRWPP
jgi:rhamnose transport system substrate-binding protein